VELYFPSPLRFHGVQRYIFTFAFPRSPSTNSWESSTKKGSLKKWVTISFSSLVYAMALVPVSARPFRLRCGYLCDGLFGLERRYARWSRTGWGVAGLCVCVSSVRRPLAVIISSSSPPFGNRVMETTHPAKVVLRQSLHLQGKWTKALRSFETSRKCPTSQRHKSSNTDMRISGAAV
jgi:hypothetical protein